jgi:hypothetical protein
MPWEVGSYFRKITSETIKLMLQKVTCMISGFPGRWVRYFFVLVGMLFPLHITWKRMTLSCSSSEGTQTFKAQIYSSHGGSQ